MTDVQMGRPVVTAREWTYPYVPTPRQKVAHQTLADEILYGGAAGGGKSEMLLATAVNICLQVPGARVLVLRRTFSDLDRNLIPRLLQRIPQPGIASYRSGAHRWEWRNGSILELGYLNRETDVLRYQGAEYVAVFFDELTQFSENQYKYLLSRLRAAGDVRDRLAVMGLRPFAMSTANPGGPGHHWVKRRWIDPAPPDVRWRPMATLEDPRPGIRVFLPAKLEDNPYLDESYRDRLSRLDPMLRRALLYGDWDILEGVRFTRWRRNIHVIEPEQLPIPVGGQRRAVGVDYGIGNPFSALWGAMMGDGLVVIYREIYKIGLSSAEQAAMILAAEAPGERSTNRPLPVALDPASWARSNTTPGTYSPVKGNDAPPPGSIAADYRAVFGNQLIRANNDRLGSASLLDTKLMVRPDKLPRILVYSTCVNLIRTLPALPRDAHNPEDVDTHAEDHAYDSLRYLLMHLEGRRNSRTGLDPTAGKPQRDLLTHTAGVAHAGF